MMHKDGEEMVCSSCGASVTTSGDSGFVTTEAQETGDVIESDPEANFEGKPRADDVTCDECGNGQAWYTIKQTGAADEPPTRFFKCTECGARWREYN